MPSKKRVHLQQFGIIHLPNSDLTYIRNPERNKILFMSSTSWKLTSRIILYSLFLFSPSHLQGNTDGNHDPRAIYTRGEVSFAKFLLLPSRFTKPLEANFSCFVKIRWMPSWFARLLELLSSIYVLFYLILKLGCEHTWTV
jgi:hypothetical protein